jgi:hypothetical protein
VVTAFSLVGSPVQYSKGPSAARRPLRAGWGADGAAFGVKNNTMLNVYELLKAVDRQVVNGVLYNGDKTLRNEANDLFDALNKAGAIS